MASKEILTFKEDFLLGAPTRTQSGTSIKHLVEPQWQLPGPQLKQAEFSAAKDFQAQGIYGDSCQLKPVKTKINFSN